VLEKAITIEILIKNNLALLILALDSASIVIIELESLE
jgi:hypothetical protein